LAGLLIIAAQGIGPNTTAPTGVSTALTALLTTESLLFAALAVSVALSGETKSGRMLVSSPFKFGSAVATVITVVAIGAVFAWWGAFAAGWPDNVTRGVGTSVLLVPIVLEPVFAWWVAGSLR
jgi:hypothetical protein